MNTPHAQTPNDPAPHSPSREQWLRAARELPRAHPRWEAVVRRHGVCALQPPPCPFRALVEAVLAQQLSNHVANLLRNRLATLLEQRHPRGVHPETLLQTPLEDLRALGLSQAKARTLHEIARATLRGDIPVLDPRLPQLPDRSLRKALVALKGVGPWTAEMFLIFALNRPDVPSPGDYAVRLGIQIFHDLPQIPSPARADALAAPWSPHRSAAMWYLWRIVEARRAGEPPPWLHQPRTDPT